MNIIFYGNGGAGNHGCEAIVRGTIKIIGNDLNDFLINSNSPEEDVRYDLNSLANVVKAKSEKIPYFEKFIAYIRLRLFHDYAMMDGIYYHHTIASIKKGNCIALSAGGDNYCYSGQEFYSYLNRYYNRKGIKTILWGCSVEPETVKNLSIIQDLNNYYVVVARESLTYNAIKQVHQRTYLVPDPAFYLNVRQSVTADSMTGKIYIGINISPLICKCGNSEGNVMKAYCSLIEHILQNTAYNIALIPHVVWESNDDRIPLRYIYDRYRKCQNRFILVEDHGAEQLKGIISKCRIFIGARTHATIAAYSTCVPTIAVGYSVKAKGIAQDLFGKQDNYVIPVQQLIDSNALVKAFCRMDEHYQEEKAYLETCIPKYLEEGMEKYNEILQLMENIVR